MSRTIILKRLEEVPRLPAKSQAEIKKRWPDIPVRDIVGAYYNYRIIRDGLEGQTEAKVIREKYAKIEMHTAALINELQWLNGNHLGRMVQFNAQWDHGAKGSNALSHAIESLRTLQSVLRLGQEKLPHGRQMNPRHHLAEQLCAAIERSGLPVDKKPKGVLCQILGILLEAAGEDPTSTVEIVKPVLKNQAKKTA